MSNCTYCQSEHRVELEEIYFDSGDLEAVRKVCTDRGIPFSKFHFGFHIQQHLQAEKSFKNCPVCQSPLRLQLEEMHRNGSVFSHISRVAKNAGEQISTNQAKKHCNEHTSYVAIASIVEPSEIEVLEPEGENTSLAVLRDKTIRRLPPFHMDDFVQTIQKAIANLFECQLALCTKAQQDYAEGLIPFPEVEFKYLIGLVATVEKLLQYETANDLNVAISHLLAAGYTITEQSQEKE